MQSTKAISYQRASASGPSAKSNRRKPTVAYPFDTTDEIDGLINQYANSGEALEVSFRKLVPWIKVGERATHYVHPYPAKLLPQIAHFFLASNRLARIRDVVLDPFAGTGTVALEANLSGRPAYYCDANPLARLICSVKTNAYSLEELNSIDAYVGENYKRSRASKPPDVVNIDKWFQPQVQKSLARLMVAIDDFPEGNEKNLLWITFSSTVRKVSNADPRMSVPVRTKGSHLTHLEEIDVWKVFVSQWASNLARVKDLMRLSVDRDSRSHEVGVDARKLLQPKESSTTSISTLRANSVGFILTSPPYAGAQKYIRASSLSLGWLNMISANQLKSLENQSIGREHHAKASCESFQKTNIPTADAILEFVHQANPLRAAIASVYLNEMRNAIREMVRVLRPNGKLVMVIGDNVVCGHHFKTSEYVSNLLEEHGLRPLVKLIDEIKSRGLMTKRNKTASVISREWVLVYEK